LFPGLNYISHTG